MAEQYSLVNITQAQATNGTAEKAISAYEQKLFGSLMKKQSVKNLQCNVANDVMQDSLRYIFTIFQ